MNIPTSAPVSVALVALALLLAACGDEPAPPPTPGPIVFQDVTSPSGIAFHHFNSVRASVLPEDMGSGVAWGDVDGDGREDLYLVNYAGNLLATQAEIEKKPGNRLYRNLGDGKFEDVTDAWGLTRSARDAGALFCDLDNDGDPDLLVTGLEGCVLYRNDGQRFQDVTEASGLSVVRGMALGATAGDYDLDGDLDIYVPCYVTFPTEKARNRRLVGGRPEPWTTPASYPAQPNWLLRNEGELRFTDATAAAGVRNPKGRSLQAVFIDLDGDRYPDLFVGNDQSPDVLFRNLRNGKFEDVSFKAGTWDPRASMGVAVGDVDGDGWFDLHLTHWVQEPPALHRNLTGESEPEDGRPRLTFRDIADEAGVLRAWYGALVGWATGLHDFDNDGDLDLLAAHGSTIEDELTDEVFTDPKLLPQRLMVLANDGHGHFEDVRAGAGPFAAERIVARGGGFADFDEDGRIDFALNLHNGRARLVRNVSPSDGGWLRVRLRGTRSNRDGIGAHLVLHVDGKKLHRPMLCGSSYLAGDSLVVHFGFGSKTPDRLEIRWPAGGNVQVVSKPEPGSKLVVEEPR